MDLVYGGLADHPVIRLATFHSGQPTFHSCQREFELPGDIPATEESAEARESKSSHRESENQQLEYRKLNIRPR